jgi:hypothetical protein
MKTVLGKRPKAEHRWLCWFKEGCVKSTSLFYLLISLVNPDLVLVIELVSCRRGGEMGKKAIHHRREVAEK